MRLYWELARCGFRRTAIYRGAALSGAITNTFFGFLRAYIFIALYQTRGEVGGYTLEDALAFTFITQGMAALIGLYAAAKFAYFGYLLPNPYYVKSNRLALAGVSEVGRFVEYVAWRLGPVLALALAALYAAGSGLKRVNWTRIAAPAAILSLPAALDNRRGLLGKGAFLVTTSKPERTSPVTRGKWIMGNILGMSPPDPPPDVPPLPPRTADAGGNAKEPTMRKKMLDHRVGTACAQCHQLMDPIGFALENFDAIGVWRTTDEGQAIDAASQTFDSTKIDGPAGVRNWLVSKYSDLFMTVASEKLLTYALGRGLQYQDMTLVRSIAREAVKSDGRFSSLVLGIVKSKPFQMNIKTAGAATSTARVAKASATVTEKGNH